MGSAVYGFSGLGSEREESVHTERSRRGGLPPRGHPNRLLRSFEDIPSIWVGGLKFIRLSNSVSLRILSESFPTLFAGVGECEWSLSRYVIVVLSQTYKLSLERSVTN